MEQHSKQDLRYAAELRDEIHREALAIVRKTWSHATEVIDRHPVEDYFQEHWDYPGKWYTIVAIPHGFSSRKALIDAIVRDTLAHYRAPEESQTRKNGEKLLDATTQPDDPFYGLLSEYPACVIDYCIITGVNGHRAALERALQTLPADDAESEGWQHDVRLASEERIDAGALFAPLPQNGALNYRKAFLDPPYGSGYTDADFDRVNAALFPNGTDGLEVYAWSTDWSDYFDDGHEWWGALCLTVYDKSLDRFAVILASATD